MSASQLQYTREEVVRCPLHSEQWKVAASLWPWWNKTVFVNRNSSRLFGPKAGSGYPTFGRRTWIKKELRNIPCYDSLFSKPGARRQVTGNQEKSKFMHTGWLVAVHSRTAEQSAGSLDVQTSVTWTGRIVDDTPYIGSCSL
ncbi:predicted protein [Histoplasma mississippiense (nom. inval.)]|uniref:predicted protein n=1 Tax=Ajellomyces capsulatus (strain NAm1 / WU24) TaxID=2059318 RepID=UPI000157C0FF|nr:predicted protein [Histoplasma mississippiense (nom. inval.)]EDN07543.1 predicted protein [Histoplasma mississippiense (nom. inval.)]